MINTFFLNQLRLIIIERMSNIYTEDSINGGKATQSNKMKTWKSSRQIKLNMHVICIINI